MAIVLEFGEEIAMRPFPLSIDQEVGLNRPL